MMARVGWRHHINNKNTDFMAQNSHSSECLSVNPESINADQATESACPSTGNRETASLVTTERRRSSNRRTGFWGAFLYGNFRPRRRSSRREVDTHWYLFDWHEPRVLYLVLAVFLLSCIDALFTLNLINAGAAEANAVMIRMLEIGMDQFVSVKISMTGFSLMVLVIAARRNFIGPFNVEHLLQMFLAGYVLLIGYEIYMFWYVFELSIAPWHAIPWLN
jgi:hypothetical protein